MKLGRESFSERVLTKLRNSNFLRDQILRSGDDLFFADENGFSLTRSEFVDLIEGKNKSVNKVPQNWIDEIKEVLRDDSKRKEIHLTNWMRIP